MLAVVGGMLLLLCLGGAGIAFVYYDEATKPNRSAPSTAADGYLRALLVERDEARADTFACEETGPLADIRGFRAQVAARERELSTSIGVKLEDMQVLREDRSKATIRVSVRWTAEVDGQMQSLLDRWELSLHEQDGWRVCGATRLD
ncbi:MAG TPA: hypothetical protein VES42_20885 [Pilimelia sp.]|nr:hypothetical protein [Pilimelia sp.]